MGFFNPTNQENLQQTAAPAAAASAAPSTIAIDVVMRNTLLTSGAVLTPIGKGLLLNAANPPTQDQVLAAYGRGDVDAIALEVLGIPVPTSSSSVARRFVATAPALAGILIGNANSIVQTAGPLLPQVTVPKGKAARVYCSDVAGPLLAGDAGAESPLIRCSVALVKLSIPVTDGSTIYQPTPMWSQLVNPATVYGARQVSDYSSVVTVEIYDPTAL